MRWRDIYSCCSFETTDRIRERFGEGGRHVIGPTLPIHLPGDVMFRHWRKSFYSVPARIMLKPRPLFHGWGRISWRSPGRRVSPNIAITVESVYLVADEGHQRPRHYQRMAEGLLRSHRWLLWTDNTFTRKHATSVHRILLKKSPSASRWWRNHKKRCSWSRRSSGNRCDIRELSYGDK